MDPLASLGPFIVDQAAGTESRTRATYALFQLANGRGGYNAIHCEGFILPDDGDCRDPMGWRMARRLSMTLSISHAQNGSCTACGSFWSITSYAWRVETNAQVEYDDRARSAHVGGQIAAIAINRI